MSTCTPTARGRPRGEVQAAEHAQGRDRGGAVVAEVREMNNVNEKDYLQLRDIFLLLLLLLRNKKWCFFINNKFIDRI